MDSTDHNLEDDVLTNLLVLQSVYARNFDLKAQSLLVDLPDNNDLSADDVQLLGRAVMEHYAQLQVGGQQVTVPCFFRIPQSVLLAPQTLALPKSQFILDITPDLPLNADYLAGVTALAKKGYRLAVSLDAQSLEEAQVLLDTVHIAKLRFQPSADEALALAARLRAHNLDLMACELQGAEDFRRAVDSGFIFFQGDFLDKPKAASNKKPGANKLLLMEILAALQDPDVTIDNLEALILRDPDLTYRFIKVVNSATFGIGREVDSLFYALAIIGTKQIRTLASLFLLEGHDELPADLVRRTLVRGRMCETIAEIAGCANTVGHFVVGLFSKLDVMTQIPMENLMKELPLKQDLKDALLSRTGMVGEILKEVEAYEEGRFAELNVLPDRAFYETAYRHSTAWANQVQASVSD